MMRNRGDCVLRIGLVGNGYIGRATRLLECVSIDITVYDIRPELCHPLGTTMADLEHCDLVFFCLPTPMDHHGSCHTDLLLHSFQTLQNPYKIIRSTVPVGFSQSVGAYFMPEFLTEANWKNDFIHTKQWVIGQLEGNREQNEEFTKRLTTLIQSCWKDGVIVSAEIVWMTTSEAEFLKLAKNCFLAAKVGIFNELHAFATAKGIDYNRVKEIIRLDPRIGTTHLDVPGAQGRFGYGGTCFPKDTHSLYSQFQTAGIPSYYFQTSLIRNDEVDRKEREWATDYWRTTIPTEKKISLVLPSLHEGLNYDLCSRLLARDHIVIYVSDTPVTRLDDSLSEVKTFLTKRCSFQQKQFFPRLDEIWDLSSLQQCPTTYTDQMTAITQTKHLMDLVLTHSCHFIALVDQENPLIRAFMQENPLHASRMEMICLQETPFHSVLSTFPALSAFTGK